MSDRVASSCGALVAKEVPVANDNIPAVETLRNTDKVFADPQVITRSGLPSPSISPPLTDEHPAMGMEVGAAKVPAPIMPVAAVLRNKEIVPAKAFTVTTSGLPSPSRSPVYNLSG